MKNNIVKSVALIVFAALAASAVAESTGTRGGENAVVCFDSPSIPTAIRDPKSPRYGYIEDDEIAHHMTSVESYDLYEARMPRGLDHTPSHILDVDPHASIRDYSEKIARRFDKYMPMISKLVRNGVQTLDDKHIIIRPAGLYRIQDENDVGSIDAEHCVVATMAAQYKVGDETFLQIDDRLFDSPMNSNLSRAVLYLHEAVYNSVRAWSDAKDSRSTRTLIGIMINQAPLDLADLAATYKNLGLPSFYSLENWPVAVFNSATDKLHAAVIADIETALDRENDQFAKSYNYWIHLYRPTNFHPIRKNSDGHYAWAGQVVDPNQFDSPQQFDFWGFDSNCSRDNLTKAQVKACLDVQPGLKRRIQVLINKAKSQGEKSFARHLKVLVLDQVAANPDYGQQVSEQMAASLAKTFAHDFSASDLNPNFDNYSADYDIALTGLKLPKITVP